MSVSDRRSWDAGRFFETLNYFGEVPFIGSFRWLQQLMGQKTTYLGVDMSAIGKRILFVGSSDRNLAFARLLASESWQRQLEDRVQSQLPMPVRCDLYDLASKSGSREKLDRLVELSTSIVVLGTATLSTLISWYEGVLGESSDIAQEPVFDFSKSNEIVSAWGTLDDVVMGGVSQSGLSLSGQGEAVFSGVVSVENSGGFASVRTKNFEPPFNFSGWQGMRLHVKGDGQRYKFILRNSDGWDSPAYIYGFDTQPEDWLFVDVPFEEMVPTFRAKSMPDAPAFDPAQVHSFQLMLSKFEYDRALNPQFEPGPFSLRIRSISAYRARSLGSLIAIASRDDDVEAVRDKLAGLGLTYQWLALEDAQMQSLDMLALIDQIAPLLGLG